MEKVSEQKMTIDLIYLLENLPPVEFVEEYNRQMGTNLIIEDIIWDGFPVYYENKVE